MASRIILANANNNILQMVYVPGLTYSDQKCFFLSRELGKTKEELKALGQYQHVKPSMHKEKLQMEFLEYSHSRKYFKTLKEWVETTGCTMDDVLYGRQDFDGGHTYITLSKLLKQIGDDSDVQSNDEVDDLTRLFEKLRTNSVPINQILVPKTTMVTGDVYLLE